MLRRGLASLLSRLPSQCAVCRSWQDQPLCEACIQRFAQPQPRCRTCALPLTGGATQCGACLRHPPPLDACICAVDYAYPWADCIARFKFRAQPGWAGALAELLRHTPWVEPALERCTLVLPMPLSAARLRQRGFNQALELARRLAPDKTDARLLLRIRDTAPQLDLSAAERRRNVRGAFALEPLRAGHVRGADAVLVDDVMTSGASLFAAAEVLREAGAARLTALVLARTPRLWSSDTADNRPMFHVVLVAPEIPPNTGNVIRLAANTGCTLHLVEPLGFSMDDKHMRRAGLDYHEYAELRVHADWAALLAREQPPLARMFAMTTRGSRSAHGLAFQAGDWFVFGSETSGLPPALRDSFPLDQRLRLPMRAGQRSLNLSNAVAVTVFEAWRQCGFPGAADQI